MLQKVDKPEVDTEIERASLNKEEVRKLKHIVKRGAEIKAQIKQLQEEEKELLETAFEKTGLSKKAVKQAIKEEGWDERTRMGQRHLEHELDLARMALGTLADLPLGEHAIARQKKKATGGDKDLN